MSKNGHPERTTKAPDTARSGAFVVPGARRTGRSHGAHFRGVGSAGSSATGAHPRHQKRPIPDPSATDGDWLTEQHHLAQQAAVRWAAAADTAATDAARRETYANDRADSSYLRAAVADARNEAQALRATSVEASRLAEMWARVATALQPAQAPGNGQPVTYDINVAMDPQTTADTIGHQLRQMKGRRGPGGT